MYIDPIEWIFLLVTLATAGLTLRTLMDTFSRLRLVVDEKQDLDEARFERPEVEWGQALAESGLKYYAATQRMWAALFLFIYAILLLVQAVVALRFPPPPPPYELVPQSYVMMVIGIVKALLICLWQISDARYRERQRERVAAHERRRKTDALIPLVPVSVPVSVELSGILKPAEPVVVPATPAPTRPVAPPLHADTIEPVARVVVEAPPPADPVELVPGTVVTVQPIEPIAPVTGIVVVVDANKPTSG